VTYKQLANRAKRLAATLQASAVPGAVPLTAVLVTKALPMQLKEKLPVYMLPRDNVVLDRFPPDGERQIRSKSVANDS
jgi:hypothetical protein